MKSVLVASFLLISCSATAPEQVSAPTPTPAEASPAETCTPGPDCTFIAQAMFTSDDQDRASAIELFESSCDANDYDACVALSFLARNGHGMPADHQQALAYAQRGCSANHPASCLQLAIFHYDAVGLPFDEQAAEMVSQQACDAGSIDACAFFVELALYPLNTHPEGYDMVADCEAGSAHACFVALQWMEHTKTLTSVYRDWTPETAPTIDPSLAILERGIELAQAQCQTGDLVQRARHCALLYRVLDDRTTCDGIHRHDKHPRCGVVDAALEAQGLKSGNEYARLACEAGDVERCHDWESYHQEFTDQTWDRMRTWCDQRMGPSACAWIAYNYFHGYEGVEADMSLSISMYKRSCELGADGEYCRMWESYCADAGVPCPEPEPAEPIVGACGTISDCGSEAHRLRFSDDFEGAIAIYSMLCDDHANARACFLMGDMAMMGQLGDDRVLDAIAPYQKSCALGDSMGCMSAGVLLLESGDVDKGKAAMQQACDMGIEEACPFAK